ncbi:MAG: THUMP domain-containing protein [Flammeovirgaceae bacterium]|nr:THUMP domain-containing protein [Flammeovirgaceae bacterium]
MPFFNHIYRMMEEENVRMIAKTYFGMEEILAEELRKIGAENVEAQHRSVSFWGNQSTLYRANLWSRTAIKILQPIHSFVVKNEADLYKSSLEVPWEKYLAWSDTFSIESVVINHPKFPHSHFPALRLKDAIADYFRQKTGRRPSVNTENPMIRFHLHINHQRAEISLDSTGELLHRRGYRQEQLEAPLNECLAASLVLQSGWDKKHPLIDPFCGSGTILIEAALIAKNIAPGLLRKENFAFQKWKNFDRSLWRKILAEAEKAICSLETRIVGSDISEKAIRIATKNIQRAHLEEDISVSVKPFTERMPIGKKGWIVSNPPYGERLDENVAILYQSLGNLLKQHFAGYQAWIISPKEALKHLGLKPFKKMDFLNGAIPCKFYGYKLFEGSMEEFKKTSIS